MASPSKRYQCSIGPSMANVVVTPKQRWYWVETNVGLSFRVHQYSRHRGQVIAQQIDLVPARVADMVNEAPNRRIEGLLRHCVRLGASREEMAWACDRLNMTISAAREKFGVQQ